MISKTMSDAINKQINAELYSSYLYLSMVAYFESINLPGAAHWMNIQVQEELGHAVKFFNFVNERRGRVILTGIEGPPSQWDSPLAAFEAVLEHEQMVTGLINNLADLAMTEKDHASGIFLQWFVTEQVEEESSADAIIQKTKLAGDAPGAVLMLDQELATRPAPTMPTEDQGQQ